MLINREGFSMNKEEPYRDQAERLKQRIEKINDKQPGAVREKLPPREEVHREKRQKTKWKIKYPVIRMLVLSFILLPIIIFSIYSYLEGGKNVGPIKAGGNSSNFETINFEKSSPENKEAQIKNENQDNNQKDDKMDEASMDKDNESVENLPTTPESKETISEQDPEEKSGTQDEPIQPITSQTESSVPTSKVITHTVKSGETLYRIAINYYHSKEGINTIKEANNLKTEQINLGQVLKIPLEK
jgi:LysM repeat protein